MTSEPQVLIIELGGQLTQNIGRVLRESSKIRSAILDPKKAEVWLKKNQEVKAIILSGSGQSVTDEDAPKPPQSIFGLKRKGRHVPILGICYGMQYLAHRFGGRVEKAKEEYGKSGITSTSPTLLFHQTPQTQTVWASHGDSVITAGRGFKPIAQTSSGGVGAMVNLDLNIWAVQFHPEATQSEYGPAILSNFVKKIADCEEDWEPSNITESIQQEVLDQVGDGKVVLPFSGGVDSSYTARILSAVLGARLRYFTIDANQLREGEVAEIETTARFIGGDWRIISAHEEFASALSSLTYGPDKRLAFQQEYGKILISEALGFGATYIPQGTLAPDLIESGRTGGQQIVRHHNDLELEGFAMLHPLRHLFKYEVRELAKSVGLPESVHSRQPFPGPGLYIRVVGAPATPERIAVVRWADARAAEITKRHGIYKEISQLVVGYVATKTSGVRGDSPAYAGSALIRPFKTTDFMTGEGLYLPEPVVREISSVLSKRSEILRVWFDFTSKPPARTELE
ncbi:MAG: gamma-glutamyl-gamma-aminobutyrate hydrolase family protein [Candidatus Doudnabacteria bacterium]